ncbi:anion permease [Brevibacterium sediminis]|uniref:SLC13 family permease n=1 Tax=Brevibacterium sediminis TaxID=1857024 RepID=UPI0021754AA0|nr:SLC13 family permease [Brevibacterium sediminis]MCS4594224.1 anion permease [Brevibacterium sediminis]
MVALPILTIIIVAVAMVSFLLEKIPIAVTAIIAALLMAIVGAIDLEEAYSPFGSTVTLFCAGMMVVGNALFKTGFADFVASKFEAIGLYRNERALIAVVTAASAILSAFLSNSAVVAIFIPLVAIIANRSQGRIRMPLAIMGAGIGAAIGGIATLTGSTAQLVTQGILETTDGTEPMGIFTLSRIGGPLIVITVLYMATIGYRVGNKVLTFTPPDLLADQKDPNSASEEKPARWKLPFSMLLMVAIIIGFVSGLWNIAVIALIGAILMIVTGCISFKDAIRQMDWNTLIILSAAQAFGQGLTDSGGGQLIADAIVGAFGETSSPWLVLSVFIIVAAVLTNFASNTALTAMFVPIVISVALSFGADPTSWAIAVTLACNLACGTPIGTACMTQTLVAGFRYMDYIKIGGPLVLILAAATALLAPVAYPF